jgi:hypothetical protein
LQSKLQLSENLLTLSSSIEQFNLHSWPFSSSSAVAKLGKSGYYQGLARVLQF